MPLEFSDYCPNGLQIEGKDNIEKIAFSLSATRESIEKSAEKNADALIVHHGLFWNFHGSRV
ncbi:MAG: Nif3-like dinuclear metal center hexameric protein, partial [Bacteriovoracales bacterium]